MADDKKKPGVKDFRAILGDYLEAKPASSDPGTKTNDPDAAALHAVYRATYDTRDERGVVLIKVPDAATARHVTSIIKGLFAHPKLAPLVSDSDSTGIQLHNDIAIKCQTPDRRRPRSTIEFITLSEASDRIIEPMTPADFYRHMGGLISRSNDGTAEPWEREHAIGLLALGAMPLSDAYPTYEAMFDAMCLSQLEEQRIRDAEMEASMKRRSLGLSLMGGDGSGLPNAFTPEPTKPQGTDGIDYFSPEWEAKRVERVTKIDPAGPQQDRATISTRRRGGWRK
jgi:hypothetical protein